MGASIPQSPAHLGLLLYPPPMLNLTWNMLPSALLSSYLELCLNRVRAAFCPCQMCPRILPPIMWVLCPWAVFFCLPLSVHMVSKEGRGDSSPMYSCPTQCLEGGGVAPGKIGADFLVYSSPFFPPLSLHSSSLCQCLQNGNAQRSGEEVRLVGLCAGQRSGS